MNFKLLHIYQFLIFYFSFNVTLIYPQSEKVRFEKLSINEGASVNLTYCMLQDRKGFLWFGTMYGLVRFDGEKYKTYRYNPDDTTTISFDDIISLYEDKKGFIWIGTWGGGLNQFDPVNEKFTRYLSNPADSTSISDNIIWAITEDIKGNIIAAAERGGLNVFDPAKKIFVRDSSLNLPFVKSLYSDSAGNIWIGSAKGIIICSYEKNKFVIKKNINDKSGLSGGMVNKIFEDSKNNIWAATQTGLNKIKGDKITVYKNDPGDSSSISSNSVFSICEDEEGDLWIGTGKGLNKFLIKNEKFQRFLNNPSDPHGLSGLFINSLLIDKAGNLWISSYNMGINKIITKNENFSTISFIEKPINIKSVKSDLNGNIWVGSFGYGLLKYNPHKKTSSIVELAGTYKLTSDLINEIAIDKDNNIFVGTQDWVFQLDPLTNNKTKLTFPSPGYSTAAASLLIDDNILYIGTNGAGLYIYNIFLKTYEHKMFDKLPGATQAANSILTIFKDSGGSVWLGTYGGLIKLAEDQPQLIKHYLNDKNSLSNNYVFTIYEDKNENFWVGTSAGLNKFDRKNNSFKKYFERDGLPNSVINGIQEDKKGNLWISTNKGLSLFNPSKQTFINFDISDGLSSNVFNKNAAASDSMGNFFFGSFNGLTKFHPDSLLFNNFNPSIEITGIKMINNEGIEKILHQDDLADLAFDENSFLFEFASLDLSKPEKNLYQYKLEGYDLGWIDASTENFAKYTNLDFGEYNFRVKGTNSDGVWSANEASVKILIHPPFWLTWWFISLTAFVIFALLYLAYLNKIKKKIKYALEIERIRVEENEKIRRKTAIDFHDELGHRLTRISLLTEIISSKISDQTSSIKPLLDKISENSYQLYNGTKDFIWSIDPHNDSIYDLLIRLKDFGDELFSSKNIYFYVNGINEELKGKYLSTEWRRHLALIFKEGMNNSLKYSRSSKVTLASLIADNNFEIMLEDDGKGFDLSSQLKGNGLINMKKRAEKLSSKLEIVSSPGKGTKIKFRGKLPSKIIDLN